MASSEELSEQLKLTQQLTAAVNTMATSMSRLETSYSSQIASVEQLAKVFESIKNLDVGQLNNTKLDGLQKEFKDTEKSVTSLSGRMKDLGNTMSKKFPTAAATGVAALSGFVQGIRNVISLGKGVTGFFSSFIEGAGSIAASIIAIPFKMFNALVDTAAAAGGGANELAQALEDLRKEFGSFAEPSAKAIIDTTKNLGDFAATGLSAYRVFGTVAEQLVLMTKLATALGSSFEASKDQIAKMGMAFPAFQKGLGLSDEAMKGMVDRAKTMGESIEKTFIDVTKQSTELGKAFGISQKIIARDMGKAIKDVKHFGSVSIKDIGAAVVYTQKLGIALDKITGTLEAFETLDSASENAAKLGQSFGISVDAFQMMEEQDPAKQLDMLRKSMKDAGVDASTFSRQQTKLLATTLHLDEETAKLAFSQENQGLSLDEIKKKSESAQKKTMTQAEAMGKLADSIERMVKSGGGQEGGFFEQFFKGFLGGIQASKEFREIIWNIKKSLQLVYFEGVRLGKAFVEMFPGVKQFLQGIADFFQPQKFKTLVAGVVNIFKDWMKGLTDPNGKASFSGLMDKLKEKFFDFFDGQSSSGKKMLDGFKTIVKTIGKILAEGIKWAADKATEGVKFIIDLLTGKVNLSAMGGAAGGGLGFLMEVIGPIGEALKHAWTVLKDPMRELVKTLFGKLKDLLMSDEVLGMIKPALPWIALALFGPAFGRALLGALTATVVKGAASLFGGAAKSLFGKVSEKVSEISSAPKSPKISEALPPASDAKAATESGKALEKGGQGISWPSVFKFLVAFAGVVAIGMAAVFSAVYIIRKFNITPKELVMALGTVAVASMAMLPAAIALAIISKFPLDPVSAAIGILSIGIAILAMVGVLALTYLALKSLDLGKLKTIAEIMWEMSKVFMAAALIVIVATGIGALFIATAGIGAAAAAAGLAAIVVGVGVMAGAAVAIMKQLDTVPMGAGFMDKVKAFTMIMDSITNFAKNLTQMIEAVKPSFTSLILGGDDTIKNIDALRSMLDSFIGQPGKGGLIGMIEKIIWAVKQMAGGDGRMLEAAKTFAEIMVAMSGLASAMKPPDKMFEAIDGFWTTSQDVKDGIDKVTKHAEVITSSLSSLITVFVDKVMPVISGGGKGLSDQQIKGAAAVGQLLGAVSQIAQNMTPSAGTLQNMTDTIGGTIGRDDKVLNPKNMEALGVYVANISEGMTKMLPAVMSGMAPMLEAIGKWHFAESDAAALKSIGPMMTQMIEMVRSTMAWASQTATAKIPGLDITVFIDKLGQVMPKIFKSMATALPELFKSLKAGITTLSGLNPKQLESGMKSFTAVMGIVSEVPKMMQSMSGGDAKSTDVKGKGFAMAEVITQVAQFFGLMVWGGKFPDGKNYPESLQMLSKVLADPSLGALNAAASNIGPLKATFSLIGEIIKVVKDVQGMVATGSDVGGVGYKMTQVIVQVAEFLGNVIAGDKGSGFPAPLAMMANLFKLQVIGQFTGLTGQIDALKVSFKMIGEIISSVGSMGTFAWESVEPTLNSIRFVAHFLTALLWPGGIGGKGPTAPLQAIVDVMKSSSAIKDFQAQKSVIDALPSIFTQIKAISEAAVLIPAVTFEKFDTAGASVANVAKFLTNITDSKTGGMSSLAQASINMQKYAASMKTDGIAPAIGEVTKMVQAANALDAALADPNANKINIMARLGQVAKAVGLGGKAQVEIQNKHVQIQVNMTVTMDAGEVEKVIFTRAGSFVRQRLDFLTSEAGASPQILPGNPFNQGAGAPNPVTKVKP
mgnify:FL=1